MLEMPLDISLGKMKLKTNIFRFGGRHNYEKYADLTQQIDELCIVIINRCQGEATAEKGQNLMEVPYLLC